MNCFQFKFKNIFINYFFYYSFYLLNDSYKLFCPRIRNQLLFELFSGSVVL